MKLILIALLLAGCANKEPKPYVKYDEDVARNCLFQCGPGNMVTGFVVERRKLVCECKKPIHKPKGEK